MSIQTPLKVAFITLLFLLLSPKKVVADDKNRVSPLYFGPNALPIPDMLDGELHAKPYVELSCDVFSGFYGDVTVTPFLRLNLPLFTSRANLSVWMPVCEFYRNSRKSIIHQQPVEAKREGYEFGNAYVSVDINLLRQGRICPDVSIRACIVSASGDGDEFSRHYDAPGYFFDASIAKSIHFDQAYTNSFLRELRFVVTGGFLCWQVDKTRQNDAYMYGAKIIMRGDYIACDVAWGGYSGWMNNGDKPMSIKASVTFCRTKLRPLIYYQYGIRDYPFHQFRVGLAYQF